MGSDEEPQDPDQDQPASPSSSSSFSSSSSSSSPPSSSAAPEQRSLVTFDKSNDHPLSSVLDQCPLVLFALITDSEAGRLASALCRRGLLVTKRYEIKRLIPLVERLVPSEVYRHGNCVVRQGLLDMRQCASSYPSSSSSSSSSSPPLSRLVPPTVTKLRIVDSGNWAWSLHELPASIRDLAITAHHRSSRLASFWQAGYEPKDFEARWPAALTSLTIDDNEEEIEWPLACLPHTLRHLRCENRVPVQAWAHLHSLTSLSLHVCDYPLTVLPQSLTSLELHNPLVDFSLADLPRSLLRFSLDDEDFDQPLEHLPPHLTDLYLSCPSFGQMLLPEDLPTSLTAFTLYSDSTHRFDEGVFPANLTLLHVGCQTTDGSLDAGVLPASLQKLTVPFAKQSLDRLPLGLNELDLSDNIDFDASVESFPDSLKTLLLSSSFDHPVKRLPSSLTVLDLSASRHFNHPLDSLPMGLRVLKLGHDFDQPLKRLPDSLTELSIENFGSVFNQPLPALPEALEILDLRGSDRFNQSLRALPSRLQTLRLGAGFSNPLPESQSEAESEGRSHAKFKLPGSLTVLDMSRSHSFNHPLPPLPPSLKTLRMGILFNQPLPKGILPESLTTLDLCQCESFNQRLSHLPASLRSLSLGCSFDRSNELETLPPSITSLNLFHTAITAPFHRLPASLTHLIVPYHYRHSLSFLSPAVQLV